MVHIMRRSNCLYLRVLLCSDISLRYLVQYENKPIVNVINSVCDVWQLFASQIKFFTKTFSVVLLWEVIINFLTLLRDETNYWKSDWHWNRYMFFVLPQKWQGCAKINLIATGEKVFSTYFSSNIFLNTSAMHKIYLC